jgi:pimeloyl-ACP methyl ester carboxylesterase
MDVVAGLFPALRDHDLRSALPALGQVPVVVLAGAADRLVPARLAEELADGIPGSTLIIVPGAGHAIILERPDIVTEEISDLASVVLDQVTSRGRRS